MTTSQLYEFIAREQKISLGNVAGISFRSWLEYKAELEKEIRERWDICLSITIDAGTLCPTSGYTRFKYNQLWAYLLSLRYLNRKANELRRMK